MSEYLPDFEITIGGRPVVLEVGRCAVALFRQQQEVSYVAVDLDDDQTLRIFNNQGFAEWLAGYQIVEDKDTPGILYRPTTRQEFNGISQTFREVTGWSPPTVEKERPSERELEMFLDVNASNLDAEWRELGE